MGAAGVGDSLARFDALEDVDYLLLAESGLAHKEFSSVGYITGELSLFLHLFSGRRSILQKIVYECQVISIAPALYRPIIFSQRYFHIHY